MLDGLFGHLQTSLARYVGERRDAGLSVERVVPEVQALVREAMLGEGCRDAGDTLMARVVRWTVAAYHVRPRLPHAPRVH